MKFWSVSFCPTHETEVTCLCSLVASAADINFSTIQQSHDILLYSNTYLIFFSSLHLTFAVLGLLRRRNSIMFLKGASICIVWIQSGLCGPRCTPSSHSWPAVWNCRTKSLMILMAYKSSILLIKGPLIYTRCKTETHSLLISLLQNK